MHRLRHPLERPEFEEFSALSDINFEIPFGQAVGIIGRNGAGKSTLLKVLTRITAPTTGRIELGAGSAVCLRSVPASTRNSLAVRIFS